MVVAWTRKAATGEVDGGQILYLFLRRGDRFIDMLGVGCGRKQR